MIYRREKEIDLPMSVLIYGTPGSAAEGNMTSAMESYDAAWDAGIRFFDTAHSYGEGERVLGTWLKERNYRHQAVILDKGLNPRQLGSEDKLDRVTIRSQIEESLIRLKTDYVDFYLLHRDDPAIPVDVAVEALNELKKEGKVLRFGVSNWTMERMKEAGQYARQHQLEEFTAVSPAYSLARYINDPWNGSVSISGKEQEQFRNWLEETQIPVFCYSALARGYLSGKFRTDRNASIQECLAEAPIVEYDAPENRERLARCEQMAEEKGKTVPQIALAWLLAQPLNIYPIIAPTGRKNIEETVQAMDLCLTKEECQWLYSGK